MRAAIDYDRRWRTMNVQLIGFILLLCRRVHRRKKQARREP